MSERYNRHHRKPRSKGGAHFVNGHHNIVKVPVPKHRFWHGLFENLSAQDICAIINEIWLNPEYKFICVKREKGNSRRGKKNNSNNGSTNRDSSCGK
jgi:hypothetical protein